MNDNEPMVTNIVPMYEFDESEDTIVPEPSDKITIHYASGFIGYGYRKVGTGEIVLFKCVLAQQKDKKE